MAARGLLLLALTSFVAFSAGSKILFSSTPSVIQDSLTQDLTMRCSLNDTADVFTGGLVGRDVTETANNMAHVTSVIVMRNSGEHVASITNYDPAKALVDPGMLMVNGDVSGIGNAGELGFIELTWQYPSVNQSGEYVCEINAIDDAGHNIVFSTSLEVGVTQPTVNELTHTVHALEQVSGTLTSTINELMKNFTALQAMIGNGYKPPHTEHGKVRCKDSENWHHTDGNTDLDDDDEKTIRVTFNTPYDSAPNVKFGITGVDEEDNDYTRFDVHIQNVDRTGFTLVCHTWAGSHIFDMSVSWLSIL